MPKDDVAHRVYHTPTVRNAPRPARRRLARGNRDKRKALAPGSGYFGGYFVDRRPLGSLADSAGQVGSRLPVELHCSKPLQVFGSVVAGVAVDVAHAQVSGRHIRVVAEQAVPRPA